MKTKGRINRGKVVLMTLLGGMGTILGRDCGRIADYRHAGLPRHAGFMDDGNHGYHICSVCFGLSPGNSR